jgi:hypothetical protein
MISSIDDPLFSAHHLPTILKPRLDLCYSRKDQILFYSHLRLALQIKGAFTFTQRIFNLVRDYSQSLAVVFLL